MFSLLYLLHVQAFKLGMYGEGYMWLIPGWYNKDWYKEEPDSGIDCTVGEISLFIESTMYISTQERLLGKEDTVTVAGIVSCFNFPIFFLLPIKRKEN